MDGPIEIPIRDEMIRLGQFLKLAGLVEDGAQARDVIERSDVRVNAQLETRRGRQLHIGDVIEVGGNRLIVARRR